MWKYSYFFFLPLVVMEMALYFKTWAQIILTGGSVDNYWNKNCLKMAQFALNSNTPHKTNTPKNVITDILCSIYLNVFSILLIHMYTWISINKDMYWHKVTDMPAGHMSNLHMFFFLDYMIVMIGGLINFHQCSKTNI